MRTLHFRGISDERLAEILHDADLERDRLKFEIDKHNAESAENEWDVATPWWADARAKLRSIGRMRISILDEISARKKIEAQRKGSDFSEKFIHIAASVLDRDTFFKIHEIASGKRKEKEVDA